MYKKGDRERFKQNFLRFNIVLNFLLQNWRDYNFFSVIGNNYNYIQGHLIESKHINDYITVDEFIAQELSRLWPGTTILLLPDSHKWAP